MATFRESNSPERDSRGARGEGDQARVQDVREVVSALNRAQRCVSSLYFPYTHAPRQSRNVPPCDKSRGEMKTFAAK